MNNPNNKEDKTSYQAELFANRIAKQYRQLKKWARRNRVSCYRLYDRDIPEIPLALDLYTFLPDGMDSKFEAARLLQEDRAAPQGLYFALISGRAFWRAATREASEGWEESSSGVLPEPAAAILRQKPGAQSGS